MPSLDHDCQLSHVISMLKIGGYWIDYTGHKFGNFIVAFNVFRLFCIITIWSLALLLVFTKGISYVLTESAVFIPIGLVIVGTSCITMAKIKTIAKTINYLKIIISSHSEPWEIDIIKEELANATKLENVLKQFLILFAVFYVILPFTMDMVRAAFGYENPYKVPLPLDGYLDKLIVRNGKFFFLTFLSFYWLSLIIFNNIPFQSFVFYQVSYAIGEMKIIKKKCERLRGPKGFLQDGIYNKTDWDLKDIIVNHRRLLRLIKLQKESIGMQLVYQNTLSTMSTCLVMYLLNQCFDSDKILFTFCALFLLFMLVLLGTICDQGESIQAQSEEMFWSIYNSPWYCQKPKIRKYINLMLMQAARPLVYDYRGQSTINRAAYMLILNGAYSYFMLIKSVE